MEQRNDFCDVLKLEGSSGLLSEHLPYDAAL
jgi:hypothetical protein